LSPLPEFYAVVPAGGAGKRLWPLSRTSRPKFLLDLGGDGRTLIQQAWDRLEPLAGAARIEVVTGAGHAAAVVQQLDRLAPSNLIVEPGPRDSMPAIALAAAITRRRHGDVVLGSFAADHIIHGQDGFAAAVEGAYLAAQEGFIATIGIVPDGPSTAYGYIQTGPPLGLVEAPQIALVARFQEKPDRATAETYLAHGGYRWNAGMFVFKVNVMLDQLKLLHPALADGIGRLAAVWDTEERDRVAAEVWPKLSPIAFDHAIAEPVAARGGLATVPGEFEWSDVGDFASLAELAELAEPVEPTEPGEPSEPCEPAGLAGVAGCSGAAGPASAQGAARASSAAGRRDIVGGGDQGARQMVLGGSPPPVIEGSPGALAVAAGGRLVAMLGVPNVVVVDTPDAVLVTSLDRVQEVKGLVESLERRGQSQRL
jgi:mannose-1-phosphate guanylyltransferase